MTKLNYKLDPENADFTDYKTVDRFSQAEDHIKADNMKSYRKKPVVIKAFKWDGSMDSAVHAIPEQDGVYFDFDEARSIMRIKTLEGWINASQGDYIIRGIRGEYYSCKPDIFEKTYEIVNEDVVIKLPRDMAYNIYSWADIGMGLTNGVAKHDDSLVNTIKAMNSFAEQIGLNKK